MAITNYIDFVNDYLCKNGMVGDEENINRAPNQLKLEVDELNINVQSLNDYTVKKSRDDGSAIIPSGTTSQRDISPIEGMIRYNFDTKGFEGFSNGMWQPVGGGQMYGFALVKTVSYNAQVLNEEITVGEGINAYSVGDITIGPNGNIIIASGSVYKVL